MVFKTVDGSLTTIFKKTEQISSGFNLVSNEVQSFVDNFNDINSNQKFDRPWDRFLQGATNRNSNVALYFAEIAEQGASARASVEGVYAAILDGNTKGFANVKSTITLFNQAQQSGSENAKAFASAVGQSNTRLGNYLGGLNGARASLVGYGTQLAITTAKTIGLRAVTMALNTALSFGVSAVVSGVINRLSNLSKNVEKTKENVKSLIDEFNSAISTANDNAKRIEELINNYDKLSKGVNNLGENISLTNEEYDKYKSLTNEIANMFPNLIQGYDNEGNAILNLKGNVEQLRDAYKEAQKEAYNTLIVSGKNGKQNDIIKQWQDTQETNTWASFLDWGDADVGGQISVADAIKQLKEIQNMTLDEYKQINSIWANDDVTNLAQLERLSGASHDRVLTALSTYINKALGIDSGSSEEDFNNAKNQAKALIQTYTAEIESALSDVKTLANAYLMANGDYDKLDEQSKTTASVIVNSLDENIANGFKDKFDVSKYVITIIDAFDDAKVKEAANKLFTLDTSSMSVGEINSEIDKYINIIADAIGEDSDALKIRLGFDETDNLLERAKKTFDMQANAGMKGLQDDINKFLEKLTPDDLKLAMENIPDLFTDGLDGASKKIQEFKADPNNSIAPSFDYSTYSEQVDTVVKNLDKVQSAIDKLNEGKGIDGKDITELANTFPEYSSEILSASDNTEKLKAVLKDIKSDAPSSLIDTLTNLKDLSEEDQEAVNGLITILSRLTNESATYADTLSDLDTKESLMSTAYKEMHDDGQISISTYQKLISLGDDYADLISIVDGKLIVNAKSIRDLTDAKYADEIATLKLAKAELEHSIAGNVGNADSYIERINAINEEIKAKEKARDLLSGFDYTTTAKKDKDEKPERVLAFEEELAKREHEINMGLREEDDAYYDWLLSAAHTAYDGLKDYQDELWKHEETVYKWRKDKEQELFDEKIENMKTLADKALDSKNVYTELSKEQKELADFNKKMQSEFGLGNVDLTKRPKVAMDDGSTATVLSSSEFLWQGDEENGHYVAVHYTPILPDGTVLDDDTLAKYLYETLEGSDDILKADTKGIVLKVDAGLNITDEDIASLETGNYTENIQNIIKECDDWDVALHNIQEEWLKVSEAAENSTSVTLTRFEYARNQITSAISEIQKRINDIQEGRLAGNADDIKSLNDELTDLRKTLADINKDELEYELDNEKAYWEDLKSKQEDIYDKEIDKLEKVKDAISKKNEEEEKATDLAEKQLALEKAKLELEKARQNRSVMLVTKQGTFYTADQSAIDEAEKNVKDAEKDIADVKKDDVTDKISEQIDVLKEQKENTQNYYDTIIKLLEDSQNDPLQAEANRDLWGKILATENGQNAIASADQDQVNKLIENGFLALNDGKYSLNNPNAEVPKDSQTITKSDITDVLTTLFGKKEGYTPERIDSIAEKFEEKTHLLYDGFTPSDVVNKATESINKTINNSQVINKVQNMNTTYHIDKIEVGYSGNDFEGLLADTLDAINQGIIVNRNKILHGR